ncbi:MAG TPA: hypothetical protein VJ746_20600 [Nitrospira sp.]|nr:hypothetical protein [Nitrospira sp.]
MLQWPMFTESSSEPSPYRVTLFFGPEQVEGTGSTSACVFNVKKRSWKGGIQVAVEITESQIDSARAGTEFPQWIADALVEIPPDDRAALIERAQDLFVQAVCWCKLELLLQAGITQENQRLASDMWRTQVMEAVLQRADFIRSYVANELDLTRKDPGRSA